jgi:hypothetical protein
MVRLLRDLDIDTLQFSDSENIDSPLKALILENYNNWLMAEQTAQAEMISYLKARYWVEWVFTNTQTFSIASTYYGKSLVQYTATEWNENTSYLSASNTRVLYDGKIYQCTTNSQGYLPTNTTYWTYICDDMTLFYIALPQAEWLNTTTYSIGDQVWYNNKTYTAVLANINTLPDSSTAIWGTGTTYSVTATLPTDTTKWTQGDNRNQQIVKYLLDIALYHFLSASPRNMADLRKERYDGNSPEQRGGAVAWLKRVSRGEIFAELPVIIPVTGQAIQYGNSNSTQNVKQDNQIW